MLPIRSIFRPSAPRADWTFSPGGIIWRILFSEPDRIVGEIRFQDKKRVQFFALQEQTGKPIWTQLTVPEEWWIGIEAVHDGVVLLHGFARPDLPEHRGLYAFDLETGQELWRTAEAAYWFFAEHHVYALKTLFDRRVAVVLDIQSGEILEEHAGAFDDLLELRQRTSLRDAQQSAFHFPQAMAVAGVPSTLRPLIEHSRRNAIPNADSDVILARDRLLFNVFEEHGADAQGNRLLRNRLVIADVNRKSVLHSFAIDEAARAPVPDTFFLHGNRLFFIRDGCELTAVSLWKP